MKNKKAIYGGLMFVSIAALAAGVYFMTKKKGLVMQTAAPSDVKEDETLPVDDVVAPILNPMDPLPDNPLELIHFNPPAYVKPIIEVPVRDDLREPIFDEQLIINDPVQIPVNHILETPIYITPIEPEPAFIEPQPIKYVPQVEVSDNPITFGDVDITLPPPNYDFTFDLDIKPFV